MPRKKPFLEPAATGLVIANIVVIGVVLASLLVTRRAWELRDDALASLAEARTTAAASVARPRPLAATTIHPRAANLRGSTMDRMLLFGVLGAAGSAFFTWRLVARSRTPAPRAARRL
jgi:hypothetical protein